MVAKFSRFYGMNLLDVFNLPYDVFTEFCQYIGIIENQERLVMNDVSAYPHIKEKQRSEIHKKVYSMAYPDALDEREVLTTDQAFIKLNRLMNGK
jgi:hypothetical protein